MEMSESNPEFETSNASPASGRRVFLGSLLAIGLLVAVVIVIRVRGQGAPRLVEADLLSAEKRWSEHGPSDYMLEVEIRGRQTDQFRVTVRGGKPVAVTRNGIEPRRHTWDTWTVPGQLETLHLELENAAHPELGFGVAPDADVAQWAEFDEIYGYPKCYRRIVEGASLEIAWTTTLFEVE